MDGWGQMDIKIYLSRKLMRFPSYVEIRPLNKISSRF